MWLDDVGEALWGEAEGDDPDDALALDGEKPPDVSAEELARLDLVSDRHEVERLLSMNAIRRPKDGEDLSKYSRLSTKLVRDWRKRPMWVRRSRLVAREFKSWSPWSQELFAPSSSLAVCHGLIAQAQAFGLELTTLDQKDAYLNVPQKAPVIIEVDSRAFEDGPCRMEQFILERLLPGQRVAAGEWFGFITDILKDGSLESFPKEPTLFRRAGPGDLMGLVLHADDGLSASTREAREELKAKLEEKVVVQFSEPLVNVGDELEFLKRRYVLEEEGVIMYCSNKHVDGLLAALGHNIKYRETPADQSFLEKDNTPELPDVKACLGYSGEGLCGSGGKAILESVTDADWGGDKASRRSKTSAQIFLGGSLLSSFVRSQRSVAQSSGESEFIASVAGAGEMLYVKECMEFLLKGAAEIEAVARTDSAAGRGISQRIGCGRVRHLDCGLLWLQDAVKKGALKIGSIPGAKNTPDVGTKPLSGPKLKELLWRSGAVNDEGQRYGEEEAKEAEHKANIRNIVARSGLGPRYGKQVLPVLLILAQILGNDNVAHHCDCHGGFSSFYMVVLAQFVESCVEQDTNV
ncbi:unnamed protein product [Symbiodinium sp. CCMP2456]|nr:unnamed protein product [Symbiodinium sp. CCMP2456]